MSKSVSSSKNSGTSASNLLPRSAGDFSKSSYWNSFFTKRGVVDSFEWYGSYADLAPWLCKYVSRNQSALILGCGNSTLSADLYSVAGCSRVLSLDNSAVAIRQMRARHSDLIADSDGKFDFQFGDATALPQSLETQGNTGEQFDCAIDKGTIDAMMSGDGEQNSGNATVGGGDYGDVMVMMHGVMASLKLRSGHYIIITLAQRHVATVIERAIHGLGRRDGDEFGVMVNCHEMALSSPPDSQIKTNKNAGKSKREKHTKQNEYDDVDDDEGGGGGFVLPVFMISIRKMAASKPLPMIFVQSKRDAQPQRLVVASSANHKSTPLTDWLMMRQNAALIARSMNARPDQSPSSSTDSCSVIGCCSFYCPITGLDRYRCAVTRRRPDKQPINGRLGVFLVPIGLDRELFASEEGGCDWLLNQLPFERAIIVQLDARLFYRSVDTIKRELNGVLPALIADWAIDGGNQTAANEIPYASLNLQSAYSSKTTVEQQHEQPGKAGLLVEKLFVARSVEETQNFQEESDDDVTNERRLTRIVRSQSLDSGAIIVNHSAVHNDLKKARELIHQFIRETPSQNKKLRILMSGLSNTSLVEEFAQLEEIEISWNLSLDESIVFHEFTSKLVTQNFHKIAQNCVHQQPIKRQDADKATHTYDLVIHDPPITSSDAYFAQFNTSKLTQLASQLSNRRGATLLVYFVNLNDALVSQIRSELNNAFEVAFECGAPVMLSVSGSGGVDCLSTTRSGGDDIKRTENARHFIAITRNQA